VQCSAVQSWLALRVGSRALEECSGAIAAAKARLDAGVNSVRKYMELVKSKDASSTHGLCELEGRQCRLVLNEMAEEVTDIVAYIATRIVPEECATYMTKPLGHPLQAQG
jgi:hypothetical protein